jgi:hypothetical protein
VQSSLPGLTGQGARCQVAKQAIEMLHMEALQQLQLYGGYPVETANNLFLAAFPNPVDAVVWSLEVVQQALSLSWWAPLPKG